jgi:hypothetical protein
MSEMSIARASSAALPEDIKHKAEEGAGIVELMDGGKLTHVVVRADVYRALIGQPLNLGMPGGEDIDLPLPERSLPPRRP